MGVHHMSNEWFRVLSIDGGGIRGIIPAMVLDTIEQQTGKPTYQLFDLIAGTSTGGILSLGLTRPGDDGNALFSAAQLVGLYEEHGKRIFTPNVITGPMLEEKYGVKGLESVLDQYFKDTPLKDALTPVLVTAYDIERRRPIMFKSITAASTSPKAQQHDFLMREVARATSAAPTYFEPVKIPVPGTQDYLPLIDGGVFANNPALCAYVEAAKLKDKDQKVIVVSLGTGEQTHPLMYDEVKSWGLMAWARQIIDIVFDGVSDDVQYLLDHMIDDADRLHRFQVKLDGRTAPMDNARPDNIKALKLLAEDMIFNERRHLETLGKMLASEG
jgi:patatin-like phospholipase/acyl hydrolase